MNQKTFNAFLGMSEDPPEGYRLGEEYTLVCEENEKTGVEKYSLRKGGVPGNMDRNIKRYHGWRGTSYGVAVYALGVRKIIKASNVLFDDDKCMYFQKITVGKDLHPEME